MAYIGSTPTTQSFISGTDYFNGTGSQTSFTLSRSVASVNDIEAVVNNVVQRPNDAYNISGNNIVFTSAPSAGTSNIYVRYLSTTTQSITPSQNTVSYASWNSDLQTETWAFRNRIINGAMMIDQRNAGASVTPANAQYSVDRWQAWISTSSKFTAQQNAGSVTPPVGFTNYLGITSSSSYSVGSGDFFAMRQPIEGFNTADLGWGTANAQTVTLSFWVRSSLTGTFGGTLLNQDGSRSYPFSYTISAANTWEQKSITITGSTNGTWNTGNSTGIYVTFALGVGSTYSGTAGAWASSLVIAPTGATSVVGTNGATFYITGVQLEKGSTATSFDYRPYGTELALCQRYYYQITGGGTNSFAAVGSGNISTTTVAAIVTALPVTMRTSPTVNYSGSITVDAGSGSAAAITSMNTVYGSTSMTWYAVNSSGLTTGRGCVLYTGNASTNYMTFSAEL